MKLRREILTNQHPTQPKTALAHSIFFLLPRFHPTSRREPPLLQPPPVPSTLSFSPSLRVQPRKHPLLAPKTLARVHGNQSLDPHRRMPPDPGTGHHTLQLPFGSSAAAANAGAPLLPRPPRTQAPDSCSPSSSTSLGAQLPTTAVAVAVVDSQAGEEHEDRARARP